MNFNGFGNNSRANGGIIYLEIKDGPWAISNTEFVGWRPAIWASFNINRPSRLLIQALEDDHAHVRASAALALGRMRVAEAKTPLEIKMKDDWDQTVRSRAREALERIK